MNIPYELFFGLIGTLIVIPVLAYTMRTSIFSSAVFFICGAFVLVMVLATDNLIMENIPDNSTRVGDTVNYEYQQVLSPLRDNTTFEPNIIGMAFIFIGLFLLLIGVLIEKYAK